MIGPAASNLQPSDLNSNAYRSLPGNHVILPTPVSTLDVSLTAHADYILAALASSLLSTC